MAEVNKKSVTNKKGQNKGVFKNKQSTENTNIIKNKVLQTKPDLKRGKLPTNWNSYVETNNCNRSCAKVVKFPKNLTSKPESSYKSHDSEMTNEEQKVNDSGRYVGIDCEMVGINEGGLDNMLARVSLVNEHGNVLYDTFVKPTQRVIDYRTHVSGVRPKDVANGKDFFNVQREVSDILNGKILVGHSVLNDLKVLFLTHNKHYIRDTSTFRKFKDANNGFTPSLRFLSARFLDLEIQTGEHSSIEDARAAMMLYMKFRNIWENELQVRRRYHVNSV